MQLGQELADFVSQEIESNGVNQTGKRIIANRVIDAAKKAAGIVDKALQPEAEFNAMAFESHNMTFGQYTGVPIKEVPLEYLCWLADDKFIDNLRRYLKSDTVRERMRRDDNP